MSIGERESVLADAVMELDREHEEMDGLSARIAARGADRAALVHQLCARFVIHAQVEERYLHPAVRRLLSDDGSMTADQLYRDRAVCRVIEGLERKTAQDKEYDALVSRLVIGVRDHTVQQNTVLLPALVRPCSAQEMNQLRRNLRDGFPAARQAAERAGERYAVSPVGGDPLCAGFRVLLQRIAHGPAERAVGHSSCNQPSRADVDPLGSLDQSLFAQARGRYGDRFGVGRAN